MVLLFASPFSCYLFIVYFTVDLARMPVLRRSAPAMGTDENGRRKEEKKRATQPDKEQKE
jgi:hypothetical protein